jgi:hypothetical protein
VRPRFAAVHQHLLVFAPSVLKRISESVHRPEIARIIHLARESNGGIGTPRGIKHHRLKGIIHHVADDLGLNATLSRDAFRELVERGICEGERAVTGELRQFTKKSGFQSTSQSWMRNGDFAVEDGNRVAAE